MSNLRLRSLLTFAVTVLLVCVSLYNISAQDTPVFKDANYSIDQRVDDLINRLTLEEKVQQLMMDAPAIDRLGIRKYNWWNECLHGLARNGKATVFPQAIGLAATFDPDLMHRIGEAIALEARAKYNANRKIGYMDRFAGLTFWSPNVNLFRDPRWGRGQETYGEDPHLISRLGVSFVNGLQGDDEKWLQVAAMAKHYAVHSGPEKLRHEFDATVSRHQLWNTYLPAFEALVKEANVEGVMGAYNRTNGEPCCAHPYLMNDVLRKMWGFDGYFVSDCWAIQDFHEGHKISPTPEASASLAIGLGCNINCGATYPALVKAVQDGLTTEKEIDDNLRQALPTLFKLGIYEEEGALPYDTISTDVVRCQEHIDLSYESALKSVVLLKNKDNVLPLDPSLKSLFVTGPMAANAQALLANYYGVSSDLRTILEGVVDNVSDHTAIRYVQGSLMDRPNVNPMDWYSEEAEIAEVTVACMGITQLIEGEEGEAIASPSFGDREYINLPPHQIEFLQLLRSKAKKLIVVVTGGSAISSPELHELADAVVYAWYPGEQGGQAVADLIFGKASPSGKLPVTFVKDMADLPPYEDYDMVGRTYRFMKQEPLYPFGYGLSYADMGLSDISSTSAAVRKKKPATVSISVTNSSDIDVEEVVQLYTTYSGQMIEKPNYELKDFRRVSVPANSTVDVAFEVSADDLSMYTEKGKRKYLKGEHTIHIGLGAPMERSTELGLPAHKSITLKAK